MICLINAHGFLLINILRSWFIFLEMLLTASQFIVNQSSACGFGEFNHWISMTISSCKALLLVNTRVFNSLFSPIEAKRISTNWICLINRIWQRSFIQESLIALALCFLLFWWTLRKIVRTLFEHFKFKPKLILLGSQKQINIGQNLFASCQS